MLVLYFRGLLAYYEGGVEEAATLLEETIALAREGQFKPDLARSLLTLSRVRLRLGEVKLASELLREGLSLFWEFGHKLGIAVSLETLANLSLVQGDHKEAVMLYATAHNLRQDLGAPLPPIDRTAYDSAISDCRVHLGDAFFDSLWAGAAAEPYMAVVDDILKAPSHK